MLDAALARRIRLIGLDVDGVLTDGGLYIGQQGGEPVELKRFDIQDGLGIKFLRMAGLTVAFVSARRSAATEQRARELRVDEVIQDNHKLPAFAALLDRLGIGWEEAAFVGDDLPELLILQRVALPVAVANAVADVKAAAALVTRAGGGNGAVREVAEALLRARGVWDDVVRQYLVERSHARAHAAR